MQVIFVKDYQAMSRAGYAYIRELIETKREPVISLNSGGSPKGVFRLLVEDVNRGLDISGATILVLDEFTGPKDASYTVANFMHQRFYDLIKTKPKEMFLIQGDAKDADAEIKRYRQILKEHPRDLQLLGLGTNGHIGGNEPGTPADSEMFLSQSCESTVLSTMKEYGLTWEEAPKMAFTTGIKDILEAKQILLLVSGKHKAEAVKKLLEGEVTPECPATVLKNCPHATVIIDEDAASLLDMETRKTAGKETEVLKRWASIWKE